MVLKIRISVRAQDLVCNRSVVRLQLEVRNGPCFAAWGRTQQTSNLANLLCYYHLMFKWSQHKSLKVLVGSTLKNFTLKTLT